MGSKWTLRAAILLTLLLGIGGNVAIFSVVDGILFQALPYPQPERLVTQLNGYFPAGYYQNLAARSPTLELGAYSNPAAVTLVQSGRPVQIEASAVSANFFGVLGVTPALGRGFAPDANQPARDGGVVLSDALWRQRFGAQRAVLGSVIRLGGRDRQVLGVMPAGFAFPSAAAQAWFLRRVDPSAAQVYWTTYDLQIIARLGPGVGLQQARTGLKEQAAAVAALFPYPIPSNWGTQFPLVPLREAMLGPLQTRLLLLLGAVGLVLLIACVNVANLLLIGTAGRRREIAVRMALGAGRGRIAQQMLRESVQLSLAGGGLGVLAAAAAVPLLIRLLPADTPRLAGVGLDWRALAFALGLSLLVGLLTGGLPGSRAGRLPIEAALRAGGTGAGAPRQRLAAGLLLAEVAIAVVVIVAAALLAASLIRLNHIDAGFNAEDVVTLRVAPSDEFCANPERCTDFYRQAQQRIAALPGVEAVAFGNAVPLGGLAPIAPAIFEDHPLIPGGAIPLVWANLITPGYLRALGVPLLAGRGFSDADGAAAPKVALVNASLARQLWPGKNPIGKSITTVESGLAQWTVAGVVGDVREMSVSGDPAVFQGQVYYPQAQALVAPPVQGSLAPMTMVLRARPMPPLVELRGVIRTLDPDVPPAAERSLTSLVYANLAAPRATTWLFLLFALLALTLGAIGVYGLMWHNVAQRTREFGVRMALGAPRRQVMWLVLRRGMRWVGFGIAIGLGLAWALSRLLMDLLYGISPADPWAYLAAAAIVAAVGLFACFWPARRATRIDPLAALRQE